MTSGEIDVNKFAKIRLILDTIFGGANLLNYISSSDWPWVKSGEIMPFCEAISV